MKKLEIKSTSRIISFKPSAAGFPYEMDATDTSHIHNIFHWKIYHNFLADFLEVSPILKYTQIATRLMYQHCF